MGLHLCAPGLKLSKGRERGGVLRVFDKLFHNQPFHGAGCKIYALALPRLDEGRLQLRAVGKADRAAVPPAVVGKIRPEGKDQPVQPDSAPEIQAQRGVRVPVDAPALVGPAAVAVVGAAAVYGVAGGKDRFPAGLHVGAGVGEKSLVVVAVQHVPGQIAAGGNFLYRSSAALFRPLKICPPMIRMRNSQDLP